LRSLRSLVLLALGSGVAVAEPPPRGSAALELRLHRADTEQDEVEHLGFYPSIVVGGSVRVGETIEVTAALAAARRSAVWENIGGLGNGFVAGRLHLAGAGWKGLVAAGLAFPLDRSIPAPDCFEPDQGPGDSLVYSYGENTACWDRSAYRRAALHRGAWDIWMWAPDWVTLAGTARVETVAPSYLYYAVDVGAGAAVSVTEAHDGAALIGQLAPEAGAFLSPRWRAGLRAIGAGVILDDTSPLLLSLEPFVEYDRDGAFRLRIAFMLPLADLRNPDVSPGLGGYRASEQKSLGITVGGAF
jgi:hypothetical protein